MPETKRKPSRGGKRPGAGRPKVADPRSIQIWARVTTAEHDELRTAAGDAPLPKWIRDVALTEARRK